VRARLECLRGREGYDEGFDPAAGAISDLEAKAVFAVDAQRNYTLVYAGGALVAATKNPGKFDVENREALRDAGIWYERPICVMLRKAKGGQ